MIPMKILMANLECYWIAGKDREKVAVMSLQTTGVKFFNSKV